MGMYNEVFKKCPKCSGRGMLQISQITGGFGEFDLDRPSDLAEKLTVDQLGALHEAVKDEWFKCERCDNYFPLEVVAQNARRATADRLFSAAPPSRCPCCGYPDCGHSHGAR